MIYWGNRNQSKAMYIGIALFLYILIGVGPIQSATLKTENPTSKSYISVVALVGGGQNPQPGEPSAAIRERVIKARKIQEERFKPYKGIHSNAQMTERMLHEFAEPDAQSLDMLRMAMERLKLSARAYSRILKVARTIADLAGSEKVQSMHIAEAIGYRNLDRGDWAERGI